MYLVGWDVARLLGMRETDDPLEQKFRENIFVPSLSVDEVSKELDGFYHEAANSPVPIVLAINWVSLKARGASREKLDDTAADLRMAASSRYIDRASEPISSSSAP